MLAGFDLLGTYHSVDVVVVVVVVVVAICKTSDHCSLYYYTPPHSFLYSPSQL